MKNVLVNWLGSKLGPVRFFSEEEWLRMTPKERLWITYKHHLSMINAGEGEFNVFEQLIAGILAVIAFFKIMGFPDWTFWLVPPAYIGLKGLKWKLGNWKDKKDFNALDVEIANRRNKFIREFRDYTTIHKLNGGVK